MKGLLDEKHIEDKPVPAQKPVVTSAPVAAQAQLLEVEAPQADEEKKPAKKFDGKGLAGVVKKLSEEKLEDKAKRITDKLEKNPDKKDKVVEKEKKVVAKKTVEKDEKATPAKKTTKKQ